MNAVSILDVGRRWWALMAAAAVLAGFVGYAAASGGPPMYESRVRLLIGPVSTELDVLRASDLLSRTYAELITSDALLESTIDALELDRSSDDLRDAVRATADGPTRLLIIRVRDGDPELSAAIANAIAAQLAGYIERSEAAAAPPTTAAAPTEGAGGSSTTPPAADQATTSTEGVLVLDSARPGQLVASRAGIIGVIAAVAGLAAALAVGITLTSLRETVRDEAEVARVTGVETLGVVRRGVGIPPRSLAIQSRPDSPRAVDCRLLATKIELLCRQEALRSILVLGSSDGADAGELAANVATVLAERRTRVALVDADHLSRSVTRRLLLDGRPGLTDLRWSADELPLSAMTIVSSHLMVLPAGQSSWSASTDTASPEALVENLGSMCEFVVVTAAAIHQAPDALAWARATDGTVLAVRRDATRADALRATVKSLRQVGARLIGVVLDEPRGRMWLRSSPGQGAGGGRPRDPSGPGRSGADRPTAPMARP
jgi:succinoglycan biosynthesis transport protein ExoP